MLLRSLRCSPAAKIGFLGFLKLCLLTPCLNLASGRILKVLYKRSPSAHMSTAHRQLQSPAPCGCKAAQNAWQLHPREAASQRSLIYDRIGNIFAAFPVFAGEEKKPFEGARQQLLEMILQIHPTLQPCSCFPQLHGQDTPF